MKTKIEIEIEMEERDSPPLPGTTEARQAAETKPATK